MPKFLVNMNYVEAKSTNFVIEAKNEDDVYDALGEIPSSFFEKNLKWLTSLYEPPVIDNVMLIEKKLPNKTISSKEQTSKLQQKFDRVIITFEKMEAAGDEY